MKRFYGFCAVLAIVGTLQACGKKDDNDSASDTFTKSGASELDGSWSEGCEVWQDSSSSSKVVTTYASGEAEAVMDMFSDPNCTTKVAAMVLAAQYAIGGAVSGVEGANTIDVKVVSSTYVAFTAEVVTQMNTDKAYGYIDWKVGEKKNIINRPYSAEDDPIKAGDISYDILKIDGNKVYFGDDSTGDRETAAKRPTKLATTFETKQ